MPFSATSTLLDAAINAHGGVHFKTVGDAIQAAFPTAPAAVAAALDAQRSLLAETWGESVRYGCGWPCIPVRPPRMLMVITLLLRSIA